MIVSHLSLSISRKLQFWELGFPRNNDLAIYFTFIVWALCLVCPICRDHANLYIRNNSNINKIRNKNDLIKYLYIFHNYVNIKTGKKKEDVNTEVIE